MTFHPLRRFTKACLLILILVTMTQGVLALTDKEALGKELFFDTDLSNPVGQSCAACHGPEVGYTGPDALINTGGAVYEGAVPGRFGNRKPPTVAYGGASPILHRDAQDLFTGGAFWDGRATGEKLGTPFADQAQGPFLNPLEQNMASASVVINKVKASSYADLFEQVWGAGSLNNVYAAYDSVGLSIAAYEKSEEVSPFGSRYDAYLAGEETLTAEELEGLSLFEGKASCSACHPSEPGPSGESPLFTDFTYDNLGVPRNEDNPFYDEPTYNPAGDAWVDQGLGGFLASRPDYAPWSGESMGKMKVPTLRNVDKRPYEGFVKAYAHNGYFKSLEEIVHFYNTRDTLPQCTGAAGEVSGETCWPAPEVAENVNTDELGDLGLTADEEAAVVAFLKTLTDGSWLNVIKFYDANANGVMDAGEKEIAGWQYTTGGTHYLTPYNAQVGTGTFTVTEGVPVQTNWKSTTAKSVEATVSAPGQTTDILFGNLCLGGGNGKSIGYWSNKNGQKSIRTEHITRLKGLCLEDAQGRDYDPADKTSFGTWLLGAKAAPNMGYMLSAQRAAMELNVAALPGGNAVDPAAIIYAPGTNPGNAKDDYSTVGEVMGWTDAALCGDGSTRAYEEALKDALDRANNNVNFVQKNPCTFSFA